MEFADHFCNLMGELQDQPWSNLKNKLDDLLKEFPDDEEPDTRRLTETRCGKLDKADVATYGYCPEFDELVVVECKICSKIIKAEAIEYHYETCHEEAHQLVIKAVDEKRTSTTELKKLQETLSTFTIKPVVAVKPGKQTPTGKSNNFKIPVSKSKSKAKKVLIDPVIPSTSKLSPPSSPQPSPSNSTPHKPSPAHTTPPKLSTSQNTTPKPSTPPNTSPKPSTAHNTTAKPSNSHSMTPKPSNSHSTTPKPSNSHSTNPKLSNLHSTTPKSITSHTTPPKPTTSHASKLTVSVPSLSSSHKNTVTSEAEKPKLEPVISLVKVEVKDVSSENDTPLSPPQLTPQVIVPPLLSTPISSHAKTPSKSKPSRNRSSNNTVNNVINSVTSNSNASVVSSVNNASANSSNVIKPELDLDKHCGVEVDGVQCSQPLSCKSHSLAMKQNVKGRSRKLEVFLAEHVSEKDSVKKKKEIKIAKATPDSTTPVSVLPPPVKMETAPKPVVEAAKKFTPIVSLPPVLSPAPVTPSPAPVRKEETEEKAKKPCTIGTVCTTSSHLLERGPTPFFKACFLKHFEDLPRCYWPHRFTRNSDPALPLRTHPFMVCYSLMHRTRRGLKSIRYYTKNYPTGSLRAKKCMNPFTSLSRLVPRDAKPVNANQVKPVAMCNYNYQKCGGLLYSSRRIHLARLGLQSILMKTSATNCQSDSASSTISYMLNNMSSKASLVSRGVPNKKVALTHSQKSSVSQLTNPASLIKVSNFKSVLSQNSPKLAVKNVKSKQFHVPNILGNKRQSENALKTNSKKAKKKVVRPNSSSDINASQMINDFLSKNSSLKQRKNDANVPVLRFAIANGRVEAAGDQKTVYSTNLIKDMKTETTMTSNPSTTNVSNVQVQQSSNSANNVGSQQITYLTASPVTFQQISLRMLNQLQGKPSNPTNNGMVKLVANPTSGTLMKLPQSLIFQDKNSSG